LRFCWRVIAAMSAGGIPPTSPPSIQKGSRYGGWWGAALLLLVTANAATADPKRVLLLDSFGRDFAPWSEYERTIRAELERQSPDRLDIYEASLATARFADAREDAAFADYLHSLFEMRRLDLVITIGGPAAGFAHERRQQLFPSTPMLFTALEQRRASFADLTANETAVASSIDWTGLIENILRVLPETNHLVIVIGNSPIEKYWADQLRDELRPLARRVTFTWFNELPFEEMLKRAAALPPRSAILFPVVAFDAAGITHEGGQALAQLRAVTNAPIFGFSDAFFGRGIVGGPLISVKDASREAVAVAVRILGGERAGDIKTPPIGFGVPKFDWRELQAWGIDERRLPAGSEIYFRELGVWERYRWQIIAIVAVLLIQAAMISGLVIEHQRRRIAELELRRRVLEVMHLNRTAAAGVMSASIAHELNQPLSTILANTETAELLLSRNELDQGELKEILGDIREADERAGEIIKGLRRMLKRTDVEVRQLDINQVTQDALHLLHPEATKRGVVLETSLAPGTLPVRADRVQLQQVIINLALNGMDAMQDCTLRDRTLAVQTTLRGDAQVEISIMDLGTGIPVDKLKGIFETFYTTKPQGTGLGLSIAHTIVESYGGAIWAENRPGGGAVFRFSLPLATAHTA
jgi:signal transduction histidine kinase